MTHMVPSIYVLTLRALKESMRQPAIQLVTVFLPLLFFVVAVGTLGPVADHFGVSDYTGFQLPVALLLGAAGAGSASGLGMASDIETGYFEKLLLTPAPRLS